MRDERWEQCRDIPPWDTMTVHCSVRVWTQLRQKMLLAPQNNFGLQYFFFVVWFALYNSIASWYTMTLNWTNQHRLIQNIECGAPGKLSISGGMAQPKSFISRLSRQIPYYMVLIIRTVSRLSRQFPEQTFSPSGYFPECFCIIQTLSGKVLYRASVLHEKT